METTATNRSFLFIVASTREAGHLGNTEWLARYGSAALPDETRQTWLYLRDFELPAFVDRRHTTGTYPAPLGDGATLLDATLSASDLVFVAPVYWYSMPSPLKLYLDQWSGWMRVPELDFKGKMAQKSLSLVSTSGNREKSQPMMESVRLCAEFMGMRWGGSVWGKGGPPAAVESDQAAQQASIELFRTLIET